LLDQLAAIGSGRGITNWMALMRAASKTGAPYASHPGRLTCCRRPMTSSAGSWRNHAAAPSRSATDRRDLPAE
jgi:hypothetical protein